MSGGIVRVAAIDCGTNSVRLLVAENGKDLARDLIITRLGQGVDENGYFDERALTRTLSACDKYAQVLDQLGVPVSHRRFVATSAARDASNRDEFYAGVNLRLGILPEIISGTEEARLSFLGATSALPFSSATTLVMDIGGGSTELAIGCEGSLIDAVSLNIGSVRITERFLKSDPPLPAETAAAAAYIDDLIVREGPDFTEVTRFIGVGGTATCLSALHQELFSYDPAKVHGSRLSATQIQVLSDRLVTQTAAEISRYPTMPIGRADVIAAGSLICLAVAKRNVSNLIISEADILDGLVADVVAQMS